MFDTASNEHEQAAVLAVVDAAGREWEWHRVAQTISDVGSAVKIIEADWTGFEDPRDAATLHALARGAEASVERYAELIREQAAAGAQCFTVLDAAYPSNLRVIYNRPPFLFIRGEFRPEDSQAIAVVGTRAASEEGLAQARRLAAGLAEADVTVLSGLAKGIDAAAHRAALHGGGRTVAVMGTGITRRYPAQNRDLADEIERNGALISQFWPTAPPTRATFPMRNVVMSGMALGTVVIEASKTSGAKMQARLALEHGKLVFLVESLVLREQWARSYVEKRGAIAIGDVRDVLDRLIALSKADRADQLRLG